MTKVEYDGNNPLRLANEIEAALAKYGRGSDHRMCKAIHFFEGELRLIAECLRCAAPQNPAKQPPSTHGVATQEEIEKYLKQLKRDADLRVIDTTVAAFLGPFPGSPIANGTPGENQQSHLKAVPVLDSGPQIAEAKESNLNHPPLAQGGGPPPSRAWETLSHTRDD
jgi:hypothetical protein